MGTPWTRGRLFDNWRAKVDNGKARQRQESAGTVIQQPTSLGFTTRQHELHVARISIQLYVYIHIVCSCHCLVFTNRQNQLELWFNTWCYCVFKMANDFLFAMSSTMPNLQEIKDNARDILTRNCQQMLNSETLINKLISTPRILGGQIWIFYAQIYILCAQLSDGRWHFLAMKCESFRLNIKSTSTLLTGHNELVHLRCLCTAGFYTNLSRGESIWFATGQCSSVQELNKSASP